MIRILAIAAALLCAQPAFAQAPRLPAGADPQNTILLDTKYGRVVIKLLTREGFYNNVPFHRVMDGFMAQTGDGQRGDGTGGSKYPNLQAEFSQVPFRRGVVGMARRGDSVNSANSQWFIMFAENSGLNGQYTVIGEVVSGMDAIDKLKKAPPGSQGGAVTDPDRIVKIQVAADAK